MDRRVFFSCSLLVVGLVFVWQLSQLDFVYGPFASGLEYVQTRFLKILLDLLITLSNWKFAFPCDWMPTFSLPDMQMLWSCWSLVASIVKLLLFPKPIPVDLPPSPDTVVDKPMPDFAPVGDGKFKDRAEELLVPLNYEDAIFKKDIAEKGESIINSLPLISYRERGDCNIQAGISVKDFPETVELIAKDLKLPDEMKDRIINAARVRDGDTRALEQIDFTTDDGTFYFGKVAVVKQENGFLDMAYSLITIKYVINEKAKHAQMAEKLLKLAASKTVDKNDLESMDFFKFSDVNSLKEYFQLRAVEEFSKKCKGPRRGLPVQ